MNAIEIRKIGITNLAADAIVNAANEGLWAGGGVCGAIFSAAGHDQLQLFKYCGLDTWAMVKVWQKLKEAAEGD